MEKSVWKHRDTKKSIRADTGLNGFQTLGHTIHTEGNTTDTTSLLENLRCIMRPKQS